MERFRWRMPSGMDCSTSPGTARTQPERRRSPNAPASAGARLGGGYGTAGKRGGGAAASASAPPEPAQVPLDHRLAELGEVDAGGLDAVAVGHVEQVDARHGKPPGRGRADTNRARASRR